MRRFTDWYIWIPVIALMTLFLAGVLYSFLVGEARIGIDAPDWYGK